MPSPHPEPSGAVACVAAEYQAVVEAWDAWRAEVDFARRFVAKVPSLDITGEDP